MAGFNEVTPPADDAESRQLNAPSTANFDAASLQVGRDGFPPPTGDANLQTLAFTNGGDRGVNLQKLDGYVNSFDQFMASNPTAAQLSERLNQNNLHVAGLIDHIGTKTAAYDAALKKV